jgi:osmotically-inducible protein OsmY
MDRVVELILRDIEDDNSINAHRVNVELSGKGFLKKKKSVRLFGSVNSKVEKEKVRRIAEHHGGDQYQVLDELTIKSPVS